MLYELFLHNHRFYISTVTVENKLKIIIKFIIYIYFVNYLLLFLQHLFSTMVELYNQYMLFLNIIYICEHKINID